MARIWKGPRVKSPLRLHWYRITAAAIDRIRLSLSERFEVATANRCLTALRQVLRFSWRDGSLAYADYLRLSDVRQVRGRGMPRGRALRPVELAALYRVCTEDVSVAGCRDACILGLLHAAGMRAGEVATLQLSSIVDLASGALIVHGKGGDDEPASMGNAAPLLQRWVKVRGDEPGPLICRLKPSGELTADGLSSQAIYQVVLKRCKRAGIKATPHDLRKTFATLLLRAGHDHLMLKRALRHRDLRSLERYDRRTDEERADAQRAAIPVPIGKRRNDASHDDTLRDRRDRRRNRLLQPR